MILLNLKGHRFSFFLSSITFIKNQILSVGHPLLAFTSSRLLDNGLSYLLALALNAVSIVSTLSSAHQVSFYYIVLF